MHRVALVLHHRRLVLDHDRELPGAGRGAVAHGVSQHLAAHETGIRGVGEGAVGDHIQRAVGRRLEAQHLQRVAVGVRVIGEQARRHSHRQGLASAHRVALVLHHRWRISASGGRDQHIATGHTGMSPIFVDEPDANRVTARVRIDMVQVARCRDNGVAAVAPIDEITGNRIRTRVHHRAQRQRVSAVLDHCRRTRKRDGRRHVVDRDRLGRARTVAILVAHRHRDRTIGGIDRTILIVGEGVQHLTAEHRQFSGGEVLRRTAITPVNAVGQGIGRARRVAANQTQRVSPALVDRIGAARKHRRSKVEHRQRLGAKHMGAVLVGGAHRDRARRAARAAIGIDMIETARSRCPFARREAVDTAVTPVDRIGGDRVHPRIDDRSYRQRVGRRLGDRRRTGDCRGRRHVVDLQHQVPGVAVRTAGIGHGDGGVECGRPIGRTAAEHEALGGGGTALSHAIAPHHVVGPAITTTVLTVSEGDVAGEDSTFSNRTRHLAGDHDGISWFKHRHRNARHISKAAVLVAEADTDGRCACCSISVRQIARNTDGGA